MTEQEDIERRENTHTHIESERERVETKNVSNTSQNHVIYLIQKSRSYKNEICQIEKKIIL
jgi:hypothetical protein